MRTVTIVSLSLLLLAYSAKAQTKTYDTLPNLPEHYRERVAKFDKEPVVTGKVIMAGNSITEGGNWKKLLNDTTVINRGIGGDVTFGLLARLNDIIKRKPSKLFLLIGVNDLSRNTPDEVILDNIYNLVHIVHKSNPGTQIYVQSILPLNETFKNFPEKYRGKLEHITTINNNLRKYGEKLHYTFVDINKEFADKESKMEARYSTDGLHLNASGYDHWVEILKRLKYL